jgi:predicted lipoprotein with Yx(FWY)xxD motif
MKTSTLIAIFVALVVVFGGAYWWMQHGTPNSSQSGGQTNSTGSDTSSTGTQSGAPVAQVGQHCGGNMTNAPVCAQGSHCAPDPNSHLPFGDVGGTCVADSASAYAPGNLLLGADTSATLGKYLIGSNGMTLYHYTPDKPGVSNCTGQCAAAWPPYTVTSTDVLKNIQAGITGKVGSITRADGTIQVTYNGSPLYFYGGDNSPGDTSGQGIGNVWYVVKP